MFIGGVKEAEAQDVAHKPLIGQRFTAALQPLFPPSPFLLHSYTAQQYSLLLPRWSL